MIHSLRWKYATERQIFRGTSGYDPFILCKESNIFYLTFIIIVSASPISVVTSKTMQNIASAQKMCLNFRQMWRIYEWCRLFKIRQRFFLWTELNIERSWLTCSNIEQWRNPWRFRIFFHLFLTHNRALPVFRHVNNLHKPEAVLLTVGLYGLGCWNECSFTKTSRLQVCWTPFV